MKPHTERYLSTLLELHDKTLNLFAQHTMEMFTEILEFGYHLLGPKLIIFLDKIPLPNLVKLLDETAKLHIL